MKKMQFAQYEERIKKQPSICLRFTIKDAQEAIDVMPDGPNVGYCTNDILDDLKDLVNDAFRPATEEDER